MTGTGKTLKNAMVGILVLMLLACEAQSDEQQQQQYQQLGHHHHHHQQQQQQQQKEERAQTATTTSADGVTTTTVTIVTTTTDNTDHTSNTTTTTTVTITTNNNCCGNICPCPNQQQQNSTNTNTTGGRNETTIAPANSTQNSNSAHASSVEWTTPLFSNMGEDILGTILAFISVVLGQSGGVGAGGLLVPVYIAVLRLGPFAIPLSKATITGASIVGVFLTIRRRHPHADRPLIAYHVALVLGPMTLAGTIIGVLLTRVFPSWLVTVFLIVLLGFTTKATWKKAKAMWKKEMLAKAGSRVQPTDNTAATTDKKDGAVVVPVPSQATTNNNNNNHVNDEDIDLSPMAEANLISFDDAVADRIAFGNTQTFASVPEPDSTKITLKIAQEGAPTTDNVLDPNESWQKRALAKILKRERSHSWFVICVMCVVWFVVLGCALLKGGHGTESIAGIQCNSGAFWAVIVGAFGIISTVSGLCAVYLNKDFTLKKEIKFEFVKGDVHWSSRNTLVYPMLCVVAGLAAGLLGIGAGMIQSPMMLEMGILPEISSATAMFMVLFTSSSTAAQFLLMGTLRLDYAMWYGSVGMVGAIAGQYVSDLVVYKYKRVSIMVFAVSIVTGLSAVAMGVEGILEAVEDLKKHHTEDLQFHSLCD